MKWFRFWNETTRDVKILQLSDYQYRMWTYLLSYASETDSVSGQLQITFKLLSLHFHQRFNLFSRAIETFHKVGLITIDEHGYITITNWNKRQFKSDNAYSRVKKYREVTTKRNVSVTLPDTDTDTDTDKKKYIKKQRVVSEKKKPSPLPVDFSISDRVRKWAQENGHLYLEKHLENFKLACAAKGYEYVDFDSAFMNAIRNDWAKTKGGNGNGKGTGNYRTDIRGQVVPDELADLNARYYARKAAEEAARNKTGGASTNDDAPNFESK